ncbi:hypothetical protein MMC34_003956 [Xylographa carneopallida]|nr:hypothetical protein [Xylographa carneopallida]
MAAASYYQGVPAQPGPYEMPSHSPAPPPKQPQQYNLPSVYSDGPPPYSPGPAVAQAQRLPPQQNQQLQQQRPQQQGSHSYYVSQPAPYPPPPPQQYPQPPATRQQYAPYQPYQPQSSTSTGYPPNQYLQPQPYPPTDVYPPHRKTQSPSHHQRRSSADAGYCSDPEYERRHHHRRPHTKRPHSRDDRPPTGTKGSSRNGILGATGGALIGDLIFPGLGTTVVGGLAGWYAGKKVDKADRGTSYEQRVGRRR